MLNATALADYLGVPERTILTWRRLHVGPPPVKIGAGFLYRLQAVDLWLADGGDLEFGISLARRDGAGDAANQLGISLGVDPPLKSLPA